MKGGFLRGTWQLTRFEGLGKNNFMNRSLVRNVFFGSVMSLSVACDPGSNEAGAGGAGVEAERMSQSQQAGQAIKKAKPSGLSRSEADPEWNAAVEDWAKSAASASDEEERAFMRKAIKQSAHEPETVASDLIEAPDSPRRLPTVRRVFLVWAGNNPMAAKSGADRISDPAARTLARLCVLRELAGQSVSLAKQWSEAWPLDSEEFKQSAPLLKSFDPNYEPHVCGPNCSLHEQ